MHCARCRMGGRIRAFCHGSDIAPVRVAENSREVPGESVTVHTYVREPAAGPGRPVSRGDLVAAGRAAGRAGLPR
ncbi:hypothetical protein Cco03nite_63740 [Catellatospora coxensis]|uniref:Uncharacterized protein n=1 Tax=Catellatospora coxensis TaxID=310354 RepID=A0A8J3L1S3_9ACTN|nr:hypothetical protein Cco03nite_63740 [Catellatospora coxensis]